MRALVAIPVVVALAGCSGPESSPAGTAAPRIPVPETKPFPDAPAAPQIDAVAPSFASPAMTVRISGSGFGTDAASVSVFFGGVEATPVSVTDGEITVHPVAGGDASDGWTDVTVAVDGTTSNAGSIRIGQAGDVERFETAPQESSSDVFARADGTVLLSDAVGGYLHRVDATGVVSAIADPDAQLVAPGRIVESAEGEILVFDEQAAAIWRVAEDGISPWMQGTPGWSDGATVGSSLYAITYGASAIEVAGEDVSIPLSTCAGATSIAAASGVLYVTEGTTVCAVDPATGAETALSLHGEPIAWISALRAGSGDELLAVGIFSSGPGVARMTLAGNVTMAVADPRGFPTTAAVAGGELIVGLSDGNVVTTAAAGMGLLAAPVRSIGDLRQDGDRYLVTGGLDLPFLAELWADGSYRILVTGTQPAMWTRAERHGDEYLIAAYDLGLVLRATAGGEVDVAIDHSALGPVASFVSTENGILVSSYGPDIALYTTDGTLVDAQYVHAEGAYAFGLDVVGSRIVAASGDRVVEADLWEGGNATTRGIPGLSGILGVAGDANGRLYVSDGNGTGGILRMDGASIELVGTASGSAIGLAFADDGAILVADVTDVPYRMLP